MAKNHFFGKKIFGQATKVNFKLKMLKFAGNYVKTKLLGGVFFKFLFKVLFLKILTKKCKKGDFWPKKAICHRIKT